MHNAIKVVSVAAATTVMIVMLAGCGSTGTDRALSGAGIGAGVGAVGGAIVGGSVAGAAVVGGAVGAATGLLTDKDQVNLGKPIWR